MPHMPPPSLNRCVRALAAVLLGILVAGQIASARPDTSAIGELAGKTIPAELRSVGETFPTQPLAWTERRAPGFLDTPAEARMQAFLSGIWSFHPVGPHGPAPAGIEIRLPYVFPTDRDYKAGWFLTRCDVPKAPGKRYVLRLNRIDLFCRVFVNGRECRSHFGGFTPFEADLTDALVSGSNTLAIFVYDQSAAVDGDKAYNQLGTTRLLSVYNPSGPPKSFPGGIREIPILETRSGTYLRDVHIKTSTRKRELEIDYEISTGDQRFSGELSFQILKWPEAVPVALTIPAVQLGEESPESGRRTIPWTDPKLWSPDHPELYVLRTTLRGKDGTDSVDTRFGFREFWVEGKSFMLNGTPIRLRGESYYNVIRNDRDFHREVFKAHKRLFGSNACRLHAFMPPAEVLQAADEAGILVDNQSAIWSENAGYYRNGGEEFLARTKLEFEEWARRDRNSPSAVIWDVENEMLRVSYDLHLPWVRKLPAFIRAFDDSRPFNNSGQGWFSPEQDMVLLHMQEHYSRIMADWGKTGTRPLIMGEFWVGGRAEQRLPNSPEFANIAQRYVEEAGVYEAQMLEMRYRGVSGVMPFRISQLAFPRHRDPATYTFSAPDSLLIAQRSNEVIEKIAHGLKPVTVFFWPRQTYAAAGSTTQRELVLCNDGETGNTFEVSWSSAGRLPETKTFSVPAAGQLRIPVTEYGTERASELVAEVRTAGSVIARDRLTIHPVRPSRAGSERELLVYRSEETSRALGRLGYQARSVETVPEAGSNAVFVIPEHTNLRQLGASQEKLLRLLAGGGTILSLKQDQLPTWFPVRFQFWSANQTSPHTYANMGWSGLNKDLFFATEAPLYAASHPVFSGLGSSSLHLWNTFDGRVSDDVFTRPANVGKFEPGNWKPLAGGTRREHVSLAEISYGQGTLLACQLHVMANLKNPQAATLLVNMIDYLANRKPRSPESRVALRGALGPEAVSRLTGAALGNLQATSPMQGELMIATGGADVAAIRSWAKQGGTVLVLSGQLSADLSGAGVSADEARRYYATRIAERTLAQGVASTNFLGDGAPRINGTFRAIPADAKVLLQGFSCDRTRFNANRTDLWDVDDAGPVMFSLPLGKGEILASTIELSQEPTAAEKELLCLLLTNAGVEVPYTARKTEEVVVKRTVPLQIDGKLKDWTEDMEDRLVTQYVHAQPIYLTSESIVSGPPEFDLNLSGICYLLWDDTHLYVSGIVFSEAKTFEAGLHLGSKKEYRLELRYNQDELTVAYRDNRANVSVNGESADGLVIQTGQMNSSDLTDASTLQFDYILKSGQIAHAESLIGETFEIKIPWRLLKSKPSQASGKVLTTLSSRDSKLQVPFTAEPVTPASWLSIRLEQPRR